MSRYVLGHRDAREFDDATLDSIHQREVAHRPREQRALGITRTTEEERCGGEIHDAGNAQFVVHGFKAGNPQTRGFVVLLGFFLLVAFQNLFVGVFRFFPVAVVCLVVYHEDVLHAHQIGHHALEHLAFCFQGHGFFARATL